jgi:hypothetical protein
LRQLNGSNRRTMTTTKRLRSQRRHPAAAPDTGAPWSEPQTSGRFETAIGSSIVEQIVIGHTPADVLRELVQNEFDAHGHRIQVTFGSDHLNVAGSGKPVDKAGWGRLSVILGTGVVIGSNADGREVRPKENGIGSKNLGLRTLFLFGDRIYLRSSGKMAVLDLKTVGTLIDPDSATRGRRGVSIDVPYRADRFDKLEPFTVEREQIALDMMATEIPFTLVKLALPGGSRSLNILNIDATRSNRRIIWRQDAEPHRCRTQGIAGIRRHVRLTDTVGGKDVSTTRFSEIEFQRRVPISAEYNSIEFPNYFRSQKTHCRIGISLPLKRERVDFSQLGRFYYPIASRTGYTGTRISINAPFEMDSERQAPIDSPWNRWLVVQAVSLTMDVLRDDLFHLFGADAYLALRSQGEARPDWFRTALAQELKTTDCWPSRGAKRGKIEYREAKKIVIPKAPCLDGFLSDERHLHPRLTEASEIREMAQQFGIQPFTVNSLIRLRCAGNDSSGLKTKLNNEGNWCFTDYENALQDVDRQVRMAAALTELSKRLSTQNRDDLRNTRSTLAADGSLQKAADLYPVDPPIQEASLAQPFERLHPRLLNAVIERFCKPFSIHDWILGVSGRVNNGIADEDERQSLYRYLLAHGATLTARTFALVRHTPVVRNHRDEWVKPSDLVSRRIPFFATLEPILNAPASELESQKALAEKIRPRTTIRGDEIVAFAHGVADNIELSAAFETILLRSKKLLTTKLADQLSRIAFLQSDLGAPSAPIALHLRTTENRACLDQEDGFVPDRNPQLYRTLKCLAAPSSSTLLTVIARLRSQGRGPRNLVVFYQCLVAALERERVARSTHSAAEILWVKGAYYAPSEVLVGAFIPRFFDNLPVVRAPEALITSYAVLGAHRQPTDDHWRRFFITFSEQRGQRVLRRTSEEWRSLVLAYRSRGTKGVPEGTRTSERFLLSRNGTLHTLTDLSEASYLEDDFPELSEAIEKAQVGIAFAELKDGTREFLSGLGLKRLSAVCHPGPPEILGERPSPGWFDDEYQTRLLEKLRHPLLAKALVALGRVETRRGVHVQPPYESDVRRRLGLIETIAFSPEIRRKYRIGTAEIFVSVEEATIENRFVVVSARSRHDLNNLLAYGLAELLGAVRIEEKRALALAILPLLQCRNADEIATLLRRQGVPWTASPQEAEDEEPEVDGLPASAEDTMEDVVRQLTDGLIVSAPGPAPVATASAGPTLTVVAPSDGPAPVVEPPSLPPIESVILSVADLDITWSPSSPSGPSGGARTWVWSPPSVQQVERDREVGRRGEELVYRRELERLRSAGHPSPEEFVVWTSAADPGADHDIRSVADDGKPLWIEVKSTAGRDGNFDWPKNEFQKALQEGSHYELWRVYEAVSGHPIAKRFPDPVNLVKEGKLRIDLATLRAVIQPMGTVEVREATDEPTIAVQALA